MRQAILLLFLLLSGIYAWAQTSAGTIKGVIRTSDGHPAESVTIGIKGGGMVTSSDKDGKYEFKKVKPGVHTLVATFTGLVTKEVRVEVKSNETTYAPDVLLNENTSQLNEVVVSANRNRSGEFVAKMPLKNLENPQVYNSVSSEVMKQQVITSYDDALKNVPGIARTWESTGRAGDGASYFALRGFDAQPSLINGLPGLTSGNLDPADVEEIQVIKGPSGTLFGASFYGYGGIINTITKKPYYDFGGEVAYTVGSYGLNRVTADINTPLSKKDKIALRINTAYQTENSFQDAGFKHSFFIAPSLVYKVNDRLTFNVMAEVMEEKRAVAPVFFNSDRMSPLPFKNLQELNLDRKRSFTSNDLSIRNPRYNVQAQAVYKLSRQWTSQTVFSTGGVQSKGFYTYIWDDISGDKYFDQYFHNENQRTSTIDVQQNFNGDFKIGNVRNRLLVGLDYFTRNVKDNGSGWEVARQVTPQAAEVEYTDPTTGEVHPPVHLTKELVDNLLSGTYGTGTNSRNNAYSGYVSDVVNLTPRLSAMVALRADYFDSKGEKSDPTDDYHQWAVSPKLGLVYQPVIDKVSVFVNYMNAFINVAPQQTFDADGQVSGIRSFKPEHANQWEAGVKGNFIDNKLSATVSYYDIKVGNRVYPDPSNPNNSVQGGKVGSKGVELDLHANPIDGLSLLAGFSHNSTKVINGNKEDFYNEPGRSPGGQGPQNQANLWGTYQFRQGTLKNFGLGFGGNYAGVYKVIDNSVTGVFELPAYTLLNGGVFFNAKKVRIAFNVNNITNKYYYIGYWSVNPQKGRNFAASLTYKF
ncbi:TonB-dependent receptor [Deminuibacter soli]|uniref:TonB-dependent receptor n=1 Tax=Deminuibacter soli TaxID=2291815 RepID=UPI001FE457A9|nr:TonB-dependent receptor [Deminuibacter soli]